MDNIGPYSITNATAARAWMASHFPGYRITGWVSTPMFDDGHGRAVRGNGQHGRFLYAVSVIDIVDARNSTHRITFIETSPEPVVQAITQATTQLSADGTCPPCASLPSSESALSFMQGQNGSIWRVGRDWLGRSALIGLGIFLAGERDPRKLAKHALAGGAAIEVFVLGWIAWCHGNTRRTAPAPTTRLRQT